MSAQWLAMAEPSALPSASGSSNCAKNAAGPKQNWPPQSHDAGQISRYENGRMTPSAETVVKIAEALDVTTDHLLVETSPRRPLHAAENILSDHLAVVADDDLGVLRSVIDGLVAKTRLRSLAGRIN